MKERGILFSAPMVRAILDWRKMVTRRIVKPQGPTEDAVRSRCGTGYHYFTDHHAESLAHFRVAGPVSVVRDLCGPTEIRCPYGKHGDGSPRRLLNMYIGTGSEAIGAILAGWDEVVCVEREPRPGIVDAPDFLAILKARVAFAISNPRAFDPEARKTAKKADDRQPSLFGRTG